MSGNTLTRKLKSSSVLPGLSHYIMMTKIVFCFEIHLLLCECDIDLCG